MMNNKKELSLEDLHELLDRNDIANFDPVEEAFKLYDPDSAGFIDKVRARPFPSLPSPCLPFPSLLCLSLVSSPVLCPSPPPPEAAASATLTPILPSTTRTRYMHMHTRTLSAGTAARRFCGLRV